MKYERYMEDLHWLYKSIKDEAETEDHINGPYTRVFSKIKEAKELAESLELIREGDLE